MSVAPINTSLNDRIQAFAHAGTVLSDYLKSDDHQDQSHAQLIEDALISAQQNNSWFTRDNLVFALHEWSEALTVENLESWLAPYHISNIKPVTVGVIAAGNIPLVGLHDVLSIILVGHHALIKTSSNDQVLLPMVLELAASHKPELKNSYTITDGRLENYDAVIATGSDNTARYFEHYFGQKPNIIRKNRNSIAVLDGTESHEQLVALSDDVFLFFGLGCRSVSHLKVPVDYNFDAFFKAMYEKREIISYFKYANNYDYNKAVYLMSEFKLLDNEFLILKEEADSYASPIASLGYSHYQDLDDIKSEIATNAEKLQCVACTSSMQEQLAPAIANLQTPQLVDLGNTQKPRLQDYADGVDTVQFLLTLS
ncbi:acyl-CoA reductase [Nonlabens ponticola]|uniref:Acyl-CoA reductase n=1 Tax=Nonlabens ponticola TaxID=2496866 RepID=A0A3S9MZI9_9FLAO|nr:acyl-CoA reductase [Nonlabens ponticola]AZQ44483.1 acyl-CoA reductase [Nonlabens ponticola]